MAGRARPFRDENAQAVRAAIYRSSSWPVREQCPDLPIEIDEANHGSTGKLPEQRQVSMTSIAAELASLVERERYAGVAVSILRSTVASAFGG